jgi:LPXTG-site transpeptidase (sortase) family protein
VRRRHGWLLAAAALAAGLAAVGAGAAGLALTGHGTVRQPRLQAKPSLVAVPAGDAVAAGSSPAIRPPARPVELTIPAIGVRTPVVDLGLQPDGALQVPSSTSVAGWYTGSPRPGGVGSAVIAGHVDSRTGPAVFYWLRSMRAGEHVYIRRADGTLAVFRVTNVQTYAKDRFPTAAVYGAAPDAELRLITCGGLFDEALGTYLNNVVVYARLAR